MKKKSTLVLLLAAMVFAVCGCNNSGGSPSSEGPSAPSGSGSSQVSNPSSSAEPSGGDNGPVTITVFKSGTRPMNEKTDAVRAYIAEEIGVDIEMNQVAENANQQLALMITSGEMPDLMLIAYNTYLDYAKQGAFTDISGDLDNYPNLKGYADGLWENLAVDGQIFGAPSLLDFPTMHVTAVREDWLKNLGLKSPETIDDWTEVLHAFTFDDPDKNGQDDTYGFCGAGFTYLDPIMGAFGATSDQFYFLNDDNTITTNAISEEYKAALSYLRDRYAEGVIDPEVFTATGDQVYQKWCRGQFGLWTAWWSHPGNAYLRYGFGELQPDAAVDIIYAPTGPDGLKGNLYATPFDSIAALSGSLTPEKKEAALRFLDYQCTREGFYTVMYGIKDVDYETDGDGLVTWTWGHEGKDRLGNEVTDMEVYKLLFQEPWQRYADSFNDSPANRMYTLSTEVETASTSRENLFAFCLTDEYLENIAELKKYFEESSIRFIMGEQDIDTEWEKYKAEYLAMGGEAVRQSQLKMYNENKGTNYTFRE